MKVKTLELRTVFVTLILLVLFFGSYDYKIELYKNIFLKTHDAIFINNSALSSVLNIG